MLVTDFQMVTYFASWLGSSIPEKWFLGVWESQPSLLHDYPAFVQAFTNHFGDPDLVETAHWQLAALWQTGSASTYVCCLVPRDSSLLQTLRLQYAYLM